MFWFLWTGSWQRARGKFFLVWHDFWEFGIFLPGDPYCVPKDMTTVRFQVLRGTLMSWMCSNMLQKPWETQLVLSNVSSWELSDNFFISYLFCLPSYFIPPETPYSHHSSHLSPLLLCHLSEASLNYYIEKDEWQRIPQKSDCILYYHVF